MLHPRYGKFVATSISEGSYDPVAWVWRIASNCSQSKRERPGI